MHSVKTHIIEKIPTPDPDIHIMNCKRQGVDGKITKQATTGSAWPHIDLPLAWVDFLRMTWRFVVQLLPRLWPRRFHWESGKAGPAEHELEKSHKIYRLIKFYTWTFTRVRFMVVIMFTYWCVCVFICIAEFVCGSCLLFCFVLYYRICRCVKPGRFSINISGSPVRMINACVLSHVAYKSVDK